MPTVPAPLLRGDEAPAPRTLVDIFRATVAAHPDAMALDNGRERLTYAELAERVYARLSGGAPTGTSRPKILVQTYFGDAGQALAALGRTGIDGVGADLVAGSADTVAAAGLRDKLVVAGVVDGRNVWRTDLDAALAATAAWLEQRA